MNASSVNIEGRGASGDAPLSLHSLLKAKGIEWLRGEDGAMPQFSQFSLSPPNLKFFATITHLSVQLGKWKEGGKDGLGPRPN